MLRHEDYQQVKEHLLEAAMLLCPDVATTTAFYNIYVRAEKDRIEPKQIIQFFLSSLLDGMKYDNWPT